MIFPSRLHNLIFFPNRLDKLPPPPIGGGNKEHYTPPAQGGKVQPVWTNTFISFLPVQKTIYIKYISTEGYSRLTLPWSKAGREFNTGPLAEQPTDSAPHYSVVRILKSITMLAHSHQT